MIDSNIRELLGVDEAIVTRHLADKTTVRLRIRDQWGQVTLNHMDFEGFKNPAAKMGELLWDLALTLKRNLTYAPPPLDQLNEVTLADAAGLFIESRDDILMPEEKPLANRFEAVAEELKRFT